MRPVLLVYSSGEGQPRKVVAHVVEHLTLRGKETWIDDVENPNESINAADYRAVVLATSVPLGEHTNKMTAFVRRHRYELGRLPTALLAVSLTAASAVDERHGWHARSRAEIANATRDFVERTSFKPSRILPLAGALLYSQEGRFVRFAMQRVVRDSHVDSQGFHDFERMAWKRLDRFIDELFDLRPAIPGRRAAAHG
jgi:menaquinone-dependent protoporphyrinogen IX oxidase